MKKISITSFLLGLSFLTFIYFVPINLREGKTELIDVSPGRTFYQVAEELKVKKLIRYSWPFKLLVKIFQYPPLSVGEYEVKSQQALWRQFQIFKKGSQHYTWITFPEGFNHYEMARLLKNHSWPQSDLFLELIFDSPFIKELLKERQNSLEGYLFPDTYPIGKYTTAKMLLKKMVQEFLKVYQRFENKTPFTRHEIVTFASIVEAETGEEKERPLIASVFYNRLRKKMKLQTDPTILYALFLREGFDRELNIRKKDILMPSTYNTYVIQGLPPGPITNAGEEALRAIFFPAKSAYLYFVSRNDGTHVFSTNYKDHKKAVVKYQVEHFKKLNRKDKIYLKKQQGVGGF